MIEWRNEQGKKEKFRLKEEICHKWIDIGSLLEIPLSLLLAWGRQHLRDPLACTTTVLCHWLENPTDYYPNSWEGIDRLLRDAALSEVANDLKQALAGAL